MTPDAETKTPCHRVLETRDLVAVVAFIIAGAIITVAVMLALAG